MYIMSFKRTGFILVGGAAAILATGLYFWSTKNDTAANNYSEYKPVGGSRRNKKRHNKTYKKGR
jgi:hypothetical protein